MQIRTKYNIGDNVWCKRKDMIFPGTITVINIDVDEFGIRVDYKIKSNIEDMYYFVNEELAFPTKDELLKSL